MIDDLSLKSFIELNKVDFLNWNQNNQFFNEENNNDFEHFPENVSEKIILRRNQLMFEEFTEEYNDALNQIIAEELFSSADKVRIESDDMIYLVSNTQIIPLIDFDIGDAYRVASGVCPNQDCGVLDFHNPNDEDDDE